MFLFQWILEFNVYSCQLEQYRITACSCLAPLPPSCSFLLICSRLVLIRCSFFPPSIDSCQIPLIHSELKVSNTLSRCVMDVMVMYQTQAFPWIFRVHEITFPKNHHQLWDTQKWYPFNKRRFSKTSPFPKTTRGIQGSPSPIPGPKRIPRLASAWTKIFKVAASWSRHVFGKTPWRNYGFFRDLNITTFGPVVFFYIHSLYTSIFKKKGTGLHQDGCTSLKC